MCFSAHGSLIAAGVLAGVGVVSVWNVKSKFYYLFAFIPLIFSLQQLSEGILWLTIDEPLGKIAAYTFATIALVIFPTCMPFSMYLIEKNFNPRKKILLYLTLFGVLFSLGSLFILLFFPFEYYIQQESIVYEVGKTLNFHPDVFLALYCIPTILPFFFSSHHLMKWLGISITVALLISLYFKYQQLFSVWCFFAALLSALVLLILRYENKHHFK